MADNNLHRAATWMGALVVAGSSLGCAAPLTCPANGGAAWRELTSKHVVLETDLNETDARDAIAEFETLYTSLSDVAFGSEDLRERLNVILFAREVDYKQVGHPSSNAYFVSSLPNEIEPTPTIVMYGDIGDEARSTFNRGVSFFFIRKAFGAVPAWFGSGLSMYYATLRLRDAKAFIGAPLPDIGFTRASKWATERNGSWIQGFVPLGNVPPVKTMIAPESSAFYSLAKHPIKSLDDIRRRRAFWASAWAFIHMLNSGPEEYAERYRRLLEDLNRGVKWPLAWERSFGDVDESALEETFRRYLVRAENKLWQTPYVPPIPPPPERVRVMDDASVHILWARLRDWSDKGWKREEARANLDEALIRAPSSPEAHLWRGLFAMKEGRLNEARPHLSAALATKLTEPRYLLANAKLYQKLPRSDERNTKLEELVGRLSKVATSASALHFVGKHYAYADRIDEAIPFMRRAIQKDPRCWYCLDVYARTLFERGLIQDAYEIQTSAVHMAPDDEDQEELVKRMKEYEVAVKTATVGLGFPVASPTDDQK